MRKVIFMIVLCLSLTACTSKQQSVIAQKREEPPYLYFLTSDQYDLNGDGETYEYGKAYPLKGYQIIITTFFHADTMRSALLAAIMTGIALTRSHF